MRVGIVGSMQFTEGMYKICDELRRLGHDAYLTNLHKFFIGKTDEEKERIKLDQKYNQDAIREFWRVMQDGDAILVYNLTKREIKNYIGGNTFLEMGFAHVLDQKIFLYNPIPENSLYESEIKAMKPIVMNGDLSRIPLVADKKVEVVREFVSTVHIVRDGKVLFTWNRKVNNWIPVGGHIEANELPCDSVVREAKEETGLDIELVSKEVLKSDNLCQPISVHLDHVKEDHKHINLIYFAKVIGGECFEVDDEGKELRWFSKQELDNLDMIPNVREWGIKAIEFFEKKSNKKIGTGVGVMVLNSEGKVLLGRRHEDPDKADSVFRVADVWTMPGGKFEYGESFEECARREVKEETSLSLKNLKVLCVNDNKNEHARFVTIGFLSDEFEGEPKVMEPDEITEWRWFDINDLPENIYFPSARVLENYKQQKFYIPQKNIEVEIQSFLTKEQYESLLNFFRQNAKFVKEDLQETHYFDENSNLRIQKSNDSAKLWYKSGNVHDEFMEEIEIPVKRDDFENLKRFLNKFGHEVKIKWFRNRNQFDWNGVNVCLDFTKGYGYVIELEKIGSEESKERILEELKLRFDELNIPLTSKQEFMNKYNYYKEHWRELINGNSS